MADRRMFAKSIVLSDTFMEMPAMTRALYFTLGMFADDDGFVSNPKGVMRLCGATEKDLGILKTLRYILKFPSGVIVIKHWPINNYIREDRRKGTTYVEEMATLTYDEKGAYTEKIKACQTDDNQLPTECQPNANQVRENGIPSIGKDSIGKNNIDKSKKSKPFVPPTLDDVKAYAQKRGNKVDPQKFFDYYTAGEWKDAKGNPVKSWKQKMITWEGREPATNTKIHNYGERAYDYNELEQIAGINND